MVLVTGNWRIALAGLAASLLIFGIVFFTVIKPSENSANQALKTGLQENQQVLNQAQKQTGQKLGSVSQLANCVASAGTDTAKIEACQTKFGH
jgi:hypothetical protein